MVMPLSIEQFIDIGFVLLVSGACLRTLLQSTAAQEERTKLWRAELAQTTEMLRELVLQATSTSINLDRSLTRRKEELEKLLQQLEIVEKSIICEKQAAEDDLPNDSWRKPLNIKAPKQPAANVSSPLEDLVNAQDDNVTLSSTSQSAVYQAASERIKQSGKLAKQVKVSKAPKPEIEIEPRNSVIDPVAYKVAKRLLERGQEIHVVARKLELPLSEVRLLDKILTQEKEREKAAQESAASRQTQREIQASQYAMDNSDEIIIP